jgi:hypothetical protein
MAASCKLRVIPLMLVDVLLLGVSVVWTWLSWSYIAGQNSHHAQSRDTDSDSSDKEGGNELLSAFKYSVACSQYDVAGFLTLRLSLMLMALCTRRDAFVLVTVVVQLFGSGLLLAKMVLPIAYKSCGQAIDPIKPFGFNLTVCIPPAVAFLAYAPLPYTPTHL